MSRINCGVLSCIAVFGAAIAIFGVKPTLAADDKAATKPTAQVSFEDSFAHGADHWSPSDPAAWKIIDAAQGKAYSLTKLSSYKPPHRSPLGFSLIKDITVGDFTLDVDAQSTIKEYPHQDLCLFFGYQDPDHFYYAHLGRKTDEHANQIFIVDGRDREKISTKTTEGTVWGTTWHHLRVTRSVSDGSIAVYFDDMEAPAMIAADKHFTWGQVGVGSFDDTGSFANVKLTGTKAERSVK